MRRLSRESLIWLSLIIVGLSISPASALEVLWRAKKDYKLSTADPMAVDIGLDGTLELVLVGPTQIAALDSEKGKTIWEIQPKIEGNFKEPPAFGHFLGDGTIDILIISSGGTLLLLDGLTGEVLVNYKLGYIPSAPPTIIPVQSAAWADIPYRDGVVLLSSTGDLQTYVLNPKAPPSIYCAFKINGVFDQPPAMGYTGYDKPGPHLILTSRAGVVHVTSAAEGSRDLLQYQIPAGRPFSNTWSGLGDVNGDGKDDVIVGGDDGFLYTLNINGGTVESIHEPISVYAKPKFAPVAIDVNNDGRDDILVPQDNIYILVNGASGKLDIWNSPQFVHAEKIWSPPAVLKGEGNKAYALFSDFRKNVGLLDIINRQFIRASEGQPKLLELDSPSSTTPVVGPIQGNKNAQAFLMGEDGTGYLLDLGVAWAEGTPPWYGRLAGPTRSSRSSQTYGDYLKRQGETLAQRVDENVKLATVAISEGNWTSARDHAEEALAANPRHEDAQKLLRRAKFRENLFIYLLGFVVTLGVLGAAAWQGSIIGLRRSRLLLAQRAIKSGEVTKAGDLMRAVYRSAPKKKEYLRQLADLYVEGKNFNAKTSDVFAQARKAFPDDEKYIKALATAHSAEGRRDAEAAQAYSDMVRVSSHPGPWAFVLGQTCLEIGQDKAALEAFTKSIRHGYEDPRITGYLADLYVRLKMTQPEVLPILNQVLHSRQDDAAFLSVYCRACLEARKFDEDAQQAAGWLIHANPRAREAHVILSTRLLQSGLIKDSMKHAETILSGDPNDSIGLRLLGACYAAEKRLDDTAMQIFRRALAANPRAHEILVAVSHGYIQDGREDDEAKETYIRALEGNPNEETILLHLAKIAGKKLDDGLTIKVVEPLIELGRQPRDLVMQLAEAYCRKNVMTDKAETIYREALLFQPDHATIATNLGSIYASKKKTDAEAAEIYEKVYERDPSRTDIGKLLAYAYAEASVADRTLKLTQVLLRQTPDDDDLKKLAARASSSLDQMDSAIQNYEAVLASNSEDVEALTNLAQLYGRKRLFDPNALKVYQRAIRMQPDNFEVHSASARAWVQAGNWDQAVATIQHFLSHAPRKISQAVGLMEELVDGTSNSLKMRWFLTETLIYDGRLREAMKHLEAILKIAPDQGQRALTAYDRILDKNPKDSRAHQRRARILLGLNREAEARQSLEQAHRFNPTDESVLRDMVELYQALLEKRESTDLRFQLGKIAMKAGKYDIAISCFQKTDKDYRWENESIRLLSRCFIQKGMLDLALQEIRRVPIEDEVKDILYELGQRYESVNDVQGAREVYKIIFAVDIGYRDVKGKLETLMAGGDDQVTAERTAIMNSLSEEAKARYELIQELGRGAMGIVYKARDNELEEIVALKILPDTLGQNAEALRRFKQEARNARRLSHPNIVRIHDIGEELGRKYISMEFVNGTDLRARNLETKRNMPFNEVLHYARQIAEALIAAHDAGIVHRDIKPANIMLTTTKKVKITDFGIAKMIEETAANNNESTRAGAVIGTPLYMSPEQVQGKFVDHRADIYSLGIMLYELVQGTPPFIEGDLAYHHVFSEPKPITREVPESYKEVVMKCLMKTPDERWRDARELLEALRKIEVDEPFEV